MKLRNVKAVIEPTDPANLPGYNWVRLDNDRRKEELLELCKPLHGRIKSILEQRDAEMMPHYLLSDEEWTILDNAAIDYSLTGSNENNLYNFWEATKGKGTITIGDF